jgi:hypothetical protein
MTSTDEKIAFDDVTPAVWTGFAMMCVGMFMAILDVQVVATSLPTIQQALNIEQDQMSWIQTAYLIAEIIAIPLTGFLMRTLTMRWLFTIAVLVFTLASIACAMLKDILDRPIKIRGGSGVRNITVLQAILEVTANKAVAGDARALGFVMQVVEKLELFKKFEPPKDHQRKDAELRQKLERLIELKAEERMQAELIRREQEQQDPDSEVNHTDCGVDKHS